MDLIFLKKPYFPLFSLSFFLYLFCFDVSVYRASQWFVTVFFTLSLKFVYGTSPLFPFTHAAYNFASPLCSHYFFSVYIIFCSCFFNFFLIIDDFTGSLICILKTESGQTTTNLIWMFFEIYRTNFQQNLSVHQIKCTLIKLIMITILTLGLSGNQDTKYWAKI